VAFKPIMRYMRKEKCMNRYGPLRHVYEPTLRLACDQAYCSDIGLTPVFSCACCKRKMKLARMAMNSAAQMNIGPHMLSAVSHLARVRCEGYTPKPSGLRVDMSVKRFWKMAQPYTRIPAELWVSFTSRCDQLALSLSHSGVCEREPSCGGVAGAE